jgi:hypothetical protein
MARQGMGSSGSARRVSQATVNSLRSAIRPPFPHRERGRGPVLYGSPYARHSLHMLARENRRRAAPLVPAQLRPLSHFVHAVFERAGSPIVERPASSDRADSKIHAAVPMSWRRHISAHACPKVDEDDDAYRLQASRPLPPPLPTTTVCGDESGRCYLVLPCLRTDTYTRAQRNTSRTSGIVPCHVIVETGHFMSWGVYGGIPLRPAGNASTALSRLPSTATYPECTDSLALPLRP